MNARETALNVLIACRRDGAWSNGVLKEYTQKADLDRREAALAARLCYGVLQNRGKLDFYLSQLLTGRLKDLHPAVRDILHMGLYQLYFMDKIPESAAVNESVNLAKQYCKKQKNASGLINGVLRNAIRSKGSLKEPNVWDTKYSHPQKLIDLLIDSVGKKQMEAMLQANNEEPPMVIQINTKVASCQDVIDSLEGQGVTVTPHKWLADCFVLSGTGDPQKLEAFEKGWFYVQDAAAKLSVLCAQIPKGAKVLDCCAAPGGKSFAAAICGAGQITSCDIYPHKISVMEAGAQRLGFDNITCLCQNAAEFCPDWEQAMDVVIADVPCSGYGIIRKKPDIRYKDPDTMTELPQLQLQILQNQARYVKPGGVLLYSTCTLLKRENEDVVASFLEKNEEFITEKLPLPENFPKNDTGMLTLIPGQYDTDGFFICRMRRKTV